MKFSFPGQNLLTIFFLLILAGITLSQTQPQTVTDFYLAMPDQRFLYSTESTKITGRAEMVKYRKSLIKIEDIKNGYLRIESNFLEGWVEIALFKKTDGSYLVAYSEIGCGPACFGELEFWTYRNGQWTDVTAQFTPQVTLNAGDENDEELEVYWKLPRVGRTLSLVNTNEDVKLESEKLIYKEFKFEWNGTGFVRK